MPDPSQQANALIELRHQLDVALADRDRPGAVAAALAAVESGAVDVVALYTGVLGPLLVDTGAAWQAGTERVWEEHYASATIRTIVEALYPEVMRQAATVPRRDTRVLLANPPRELHDLGLRMLADRFELAGYPVTFLGANTPLDEIAAAATATDADLVVLSVSTLYERLELREFLAALRKRLPSCSIRVGGAAFTHATGWPADDLLDLDALGLTGGPDGRPR